MQLVIEKNKFLIPTAFIASVFCALISDYLLIGIGLLLLILFSYYSPKRYFTAVSIIALLTLVSDIGLTERLFVQIISLCVLFFIFFKEQILQSNKYKSFPALLKVYIIFLLFSMTLSLILSNYFLAGVELVARTLFFFVLVYILYSLIHDKNDIKNLLNSLIIACTLISLSVLYEFAVSGFWFLDLSAHTYQRISGIISNVNATGGFFAVCIPLVTGLLFTHEIHKEKKKIFLIVLFILLLGLLLTTSRAAFISVLISMTILLAFLKRNLLKWFLSGIIMVFLLFVFYKPFNELVSLMFRFEEGVAGRNIFWSLAMNIIKDNFWFGIGPGAYKHEMFNYMPVLVDSWPGSVLVRIHSMTDGSNASHNFFLLFFSDLGIFGLLSAVFLPILFFKLGIPLLKLFKPGNDFYYKITLTIIAIGTGLFVRSFFESHGFITYGYITRDLPFWICFAVIIHLYQTNKEKLKQFK